MTIEDIVEMAETLDLHWDYEDDDPELQEDENIFLWHNADTEPDGGMLIRFRDGKAYVADARTLGGAIVGAGVNGVRHDHDDDVAQQISNYAERYRRLPPDTAEYHVVPSLETPPPKETSNRGGEWRTRSQRKEGAFKAVDPLGHFYYVEVFRDVTADRLDEAQRLVTADGENVERIAKGRYRLIHERIDLSSDDPAAP